MLKPGFYWVKTSDGSKVRWELAEFVGADYIDPYKDYGWIFLGIEESIDILEIGKEIVL